MVRGKFFSFLFFFMYCRTRGICAVRGPRDRKERRPCSSFDLVGVSSFVAGAAGKGRRCVVEQWFSTRHFVVRERRCATPVIPDLLPPLLLLHEAMKCCIRSGRCALRVLLHNFPCIFLSPLP